MKNKKLIVPAIVLGALVLGAAVFSAKALADNNATDPKTEQAEALASKLGIDKDKVSTALDEIHAEKQKVRQAEVSSKLDEAVKDGVITPEQKQKIIDKQAELQGQRGQKRTEMEQWFKDNGIDSSKIHTYLGFGKGDGRGGSGCPLHDN